MVPSDSIPTSPITGGTSVGVAFLAIMAQIKNVSIIKILRETHHCHASARHRSYQTLTPVQQEHGNHIFLHMPAHRIRGCCFIMKHCIMPCPQFFQSHPKDFPFIQDKPAGTKMFPESFDVMIIIHGKVDRIEPPPLPSPLPPARWPAPVSAGQDGS